MAEQQTLAIEISIDVSNVVANLRRCGDAFHAAADRIERAGTIAGAEESSVRMASVPNGEQW